MSTANETGHSEGHQGGRQHAHPPSGPGDTWGGQELKGAVTVAASWLARHAQSINALNVYPVPDGDTGTNMSLTMQAAIDEVADSPSHSAAEIAAGLSHGALMGARGNSGVILSQIWRGFAEGIGGNERISAHDFAEGLAAATATAYRAVLQPVEGTILTVVKDMGEEALRASGNVDEFTHVLAATVKAGQASVARTPSLLDKLRDAGVVDAGGEGLYMILDGIRRYSEGEEIEPVRLDESSEAAMTPELAHRVNIEHGEYGYCTNFLLSGTGAGWDFEEVRARIASLGDSAVIVGDDHLVKVHVHTEEPGTVLNYATKLGSLHQISIANMQEQHEEYLHMHAVGGGGAHAEELLPPAAGRVNGPVLQSKIGVLAVASGDGLSEAFRSMGATALVEGGQTMNPSTEQLLKTIESVPQDEVILLPNNSNIILTARQTAGLTRKRVVVVPTETIPQGMAALIAFNFEASLDENAVSMQEAASQVETGEITRAVRDAKIDGLTVRAGDLIGLLNSNLVTKGSSREAVAWDLLKRMGAANRELLTIYWGGDITRKEATAFRDSLHKRYRSLQVELIEGGQPFYDYILSAE